MSDEKPGFNAQPRKVVVGLFALLLAATGASVATGSVAVAQDRDPSAGPDFLTLPAHGLTLASTAPRRRGVEGRRAVAAASGTGTRTYDVHVVGFGVGAQPSSIDSAKSAAMVSAVDRIYDGATFGRIRLRFVKFYSGETLPGPVCSVSSVSSGSLEDRSSPVVKATGSLSATNGAAGYLRISVTPPQACGGVAGQAWIDGVDSWINGGLNAAIAASRQTVAHELGHNLGLGHSATLECDTDDALIDESATCVDLTYNDESDIMGNNPNSARFSGWHLADLGVVGPEATRRLFGRAGDRTYSATLRSHYSQPESTAVRTLRIGDARVEYRPAVGPDAYLSDRDGAGRGVRVRIPPDANRFSSSADSLLVWPFKSMSWSESRWVIDYHPHSLGPGDSVLLSDGSTVSVTAVDGATATVVARVAADTEPPDEPSLDLEWDYLGGEVPERLPVEGSIEGWDDQLLERAVLKDKGHTIQTFTLQEDRPQPGYADLSVDGPLLAGVDHVLTVEVIDGAGNTSVSEPVTLRAFRWGDISKPLSITASARRPPASGGASIGRTVRGRVSVEVPRQFDTVVAGGASPCRRPNVFFGDSEVDEVSRPGSQSFFDYAVLARHVAVSVRCGSQMGSVDVPIALQPSRTVRIDGLRRLARVTGASGIQLWTSRSKPGRIHWRAPRSGRAFVVVRGSWSLSAAGKRLICRSEVYAAAQLCGIKVKKGQVYTAAGRGRSKMVGSWVE